MHRVSLIEENGEITEYKVEEGRTVFDALQDLGRDLPHGCLSGSCGSCRMWVKKSKDNLAKAGIIESNTIETIAGEYPEVPDDEMRLSCRAKVKGDITIIPLK